MLVLYDQAASRNEDDNDDQIPLRGNEDDNQILLRSNENERTAELYDNVNEDEDIATELLVKG